ncbi:MAG: mechanosensitive ion channel [Acidobacteria bacterium]|nr:mechanosensitive ion channel [Acidobacteriota bacterium]
MDYSDTIVQTISTLLSTWGLRVAGAIAVLVLGKIVASWARRLALRLMEKARVDKTLAPFLSGLVYYLLLAFVAIAVLGIFGIPTASFVAVLGAAGLAVGLAMQGTLSNFSAGVMLLLFRPFATDDFVDVGGTKGVVLQIGIFSTTLRSVDNIKITVPNAQIYGHTILNYNGFETRRVDMVMGISYDDDIQLAIDTIHRIVSADPRVLDDPAPQVAVSNLGSSSVDIVVRPWCSTGDYWGLLFDLTRRLKEGLEAAGCSIPYPQQDVHLQRVEASAA